MAVAVITGSSGLIGSAAASHFARRGLDVVGIDNDSRRTFLGADASTRWNRSRLLERVPGYRHLDEDIRDRDAMERLFLSYGRDIVLVIHAAAQPSHEWSLGEPATDFAVNAMGTVNILELSRKHCPETVFVFTSTNKVYGDRPNHLPLVELETRWELPAGHEYSDGITETMPLDRCSHTPMGTSKLAADLMVQEYGRAYGMRTVSFRGGCFAGPGQSGTRLHGFLAYLMRCAITGEPYMILGYKGKQVRDNLHSQDVVAAIDQFFQAPRPGEVYNLGGGRANSCSVLEAIAMCESISGRPIRRNYRDQPRQADHIWYVSGCRRFREHYPSWSRTIDLTRMLSELRDASRDRWRVQARA